MSLPDFTTQTALFSISSRTDQLFGATDRYRWFASKIYPLLVSARGQLEKLYCLDNGRPAVEPVVLLGVSLLQYWEGMPDRQAVEQLRYHAGWSFALNRSLGQEVFHPTCLAHFRRRLIENEQSALIFRQVLDGLLAAGWVARQSKQRLDADAGLRLGQLDELVGLRARSVATGRKGTAAERGGIRAASLLGGVAGALR